MTLSQKTMTLEEGATKTLTATVEPSNATDKTVRYTTSDREIATVSSSGDVRTVTGIKEGTATITARAGQQSDVCTVTVKAPPPPEPDPQIIATFIKPSSLELEIGEQGLMELIASYDDGTERTLDVSDWLSSDESVASVDSEGKVAAHSHGEATIFANGYEANVSVLEPPTPPPPQEEEEDSDPPVDEEEADD
ncbi:Ig-like domain-containing protein [Shouchella clausii]|uniref:Ig-like domain-containing protein n=1 Tax=Shouchella clausii TaxID=79880 RepID=UPI002DBE7535|nr:Ig-like domain-containing protein [Shouchella clausii]MEB5480788.1 Ig-like domain-containing protein [Shouchella clausii]